MQVTRTRNKIQKAAQGGKVVSAKISEATYTQLEHLMVMGGYKNKQDFLERALLSKMADVAAGLQHHFVDRMVEGRSDYEREVEYKSRGILGSF